MPLDDQILGLGVYTPREAARLVGTDPVSVLRWTRGTATSAPLWSAHYQFLDSATTEISFLDLIEVRVVYAMRKSGLSLQAIRFAITCAQQAFGIERPLASQAFKTDGSEILMDAIENDGQLVSLSKKRPGQKVFKDIVARSLNDLEYEDQKVARWRPRRFRNVVIDPARNFGDPLLDEYGVSTKMVWEEYQIFKDLDYLSKIYEIPTATLRMGLSFEQSLEEGNG